MSRIAFKCSKCGWETELVGEKHHCAMSETPKAPREWWIPDADNWEDDCGRSIFARRKEDLKECEGEAFVRVIEHSAYLELQRENAELTALIAAKDAELEELQSYMPKIPTEPYEKRLAKEHAAMKEKLELAREALTKLSEVESPDWYVEMEGLNVAVSTFARECLDKIK